MTDIDYKALSLAWLTVTTSIYDPDEPLYAPLRAVVAAYREQQRARGVVEVNREDLDTVMQCYDDDWATAAYDRIRDALSASDEAVSNA